MTTPLTEEDERAIAARCEKATEGPWKDYIGTAVPDHVITGGKTHICRVLFKYETPAIRNANAAFIAHARTDIPRLLSARAEDRAEIERLRAEIDHANFAAQVDLQIDIATRAEREICAKIADALFVARSRQARELADEGLPHSDVVAAAGMAAHIARAIRAQAIESANQEGVKP